MGYTVAGLVDKPVEAQGVIDDLTTLCLCERSDISLIARDHPGQGSLPVGEALRATGQVAATAGAAAAKTLASVLGLGSAIVSRKVSGFGVLSAVGQAGAALSKTAFDTAQDAVKALMDFGIERNLARVYADALGTGSILIVVEAKTQKMADCASRVMATRRAGAPEARSA
jgi:hypothetical protein